MTDSSNENCSDKKFVLSSILFNPACGGEIKVQSYCIPF